jgi:hypothetical protein
MTKNNKEVTLRLVKDDSGITAANETEGTIDFFDKTEEARKDFILYFLEEFINKEVK